MSRDALHVDTAATWRGGQNQVLLTARGMAARGWSAAIACRAGGELEARAGAAGLAVRRLPFRGDLWPPAILALARLLRRERPGALVVHDPHGVSAGLVAARLAGRVPLVAVRRVDFPLRGPFSRAKYAACGRVIVVSRAIGSVVASDAFFPFADGLLAAAEAGATAVIQPGGSIRDDEVIAAADAKNLAMVFTGMRHFRH